MIWIDENVNKEIRSYVRNLYLGKENNYIRTSRGVYLTGNNYSYKKLKDMGISNENYLNIKIDSTAAISTVTTLPFEVSVPARSDIKPQTFNLYVLVVPPQTTIAEEFLQVLGYAAVEVTDYYPNESNPNGVEGMVVSRLYTSPLDLALGGRPRLIPWD